MDHCLEYVAIFRAKRDHFIESMTLEENAIMKLHAEYYQHLSSEGKLILNGVNLSGVYEIVVFKAESPETARQIFEQDPAVKAGVVNANLHFGVTNHYAKAREEKTLICTG